jgi:hypothetical protein
VPGECPGLDSQVDELLTADMAMHRQHSRARAMPARPIRTRQRSWRPSGQRQQSNRLRLPGSPWQLQRANTSKILKQP